MKKNIVIVGIGKTAQHVYEFIKDYNLYNVLGFSVNKAFMPQIKTLYNLPIFSLETIEKDIDIKRDYLFVAILWNHLNAERKNIFDNLKSRDIRLANLISPKACIRSNIFGENCWIHDNVVIQHNAVIGDNVIVMTGSLIGADSLIEDHCFLGAKSTIAGGCHIGEQAFIGLNATVFDDTTIGKKCIVGACTAINRNISDFTLVKTKTSQSITQYDEKMIEDKLVSQKNIR